MKLSRGRSINAGVTGPPMPGAPSGYTGATGITYAMEPIRLARDVAWMAHLNQKRQSGELTFYHVARVANTFERNGLMIYPIVAYLHDVLEDTDLPERALTLLFGPTVAHDVEMLTRQTYRGETYFEYIDRIRLYGSTAALLVKLADLEDNLIEPPIPFDGYDSLRTRYIQANVILRREARDRGIL